MALMYHYCSPQTFQQIIEKKKLWLSSINNLNDSAEGKWFENSLIKVLRSNEGEFGKEWCDLVLGVYSDCNVPRYITCFSMNSDSLSQWRAYAEDGTGVAIGFDEDLFDLNYINGHKGYESGSDTVICDVLYKDANDIELELYNFIKSMRHMVTNSNAFASTIASRFMNMATKYKNPAFSEEKEKRLICTPYFIGSCDGEMTILSRVREPIGEMKHRISSGYLTTYYELDFSKMDCVCEIILGPKNKFHDHDLTLFLKSNALSKVKFTRSAATYR